MALFDELQEEMPKLKERERIAIDARKLAEEELSIEKKENFILQEKNEIL